MGKSNGKRFYFRSRSALKQCSSSRQPECLRGGRQPKDREDRISSLPADILELILSFLTCKEKAKTSLVSRQWLYLWTHTQVLHFDTPVNYRAEVPSYEESRKFVNQVNHALSLHRSQILNEFRITFFLDKRYKKDISSWLGYALNRKVENLELNFLVDGWCPMDVDKAYDFSNRFIKLNSEKAVQVANPDRRGNCFVQCLDFRSLKSLSLNCVKVSGEAIDFVLRNSPFLERLEVVGSQELHNLVISDPKLVLKYLHIQDCSQLKRVSLSNINLVTLGIKTEDLRLTNLPMLVDLLIYGYWNEIRRALSQSACCHSQLGSLTINPVSEDIPQLSELNRLTQLKRLEIRFISLDDKHLIKLVSFIEACRCLEEFVLMRGWCDDKLTNGSVAKVERPPFKFLKVFEFIGYYGRAGELELVMHIIKNSIALEQIVLDPRCPLKHAPPSLGEEEARKVARQQFDGLKESTQPRVVIR